MELESMDMDTPHDDTRAHTHTHVVLETRAATSHEVSEDEKRTAKAQHWSPKQIRQAINTNGWQGPFCDRNEASRVTYITVQQC